MHHKILKMDNLPDKLYEFGTRKKYKKGDIIFHAGDKVEQMYLLKKGSIVPITYYPDGSMIYNYLILAPFFLYLPLKCYVLQSPTTFICLENSEIIIINNNTILDISKKDEEIFNCINDISLFLLNLFYYDAYDYAYLPSEKKIALILLEFAEEFGEEHNGDIKINYKISLQFISNLVGVKKLTAARIFNKLRDKNILDYYEGYYYVKDLELLKKSSQIILMEKQRQKFLKQLKKELE